LQPATDTEAERATPYQACRRKGFVMKRLLIVAALMSFADVASAQTTKVSPLFTHDLPDIAGKEGMMLTVEYPPGGSDPIHRHNADVFVYVLEGSIVMQVKDGSPVTLHQGQTFYEAPNDIHLVGRNASKTEPAKFLVFFVKDKGAPPLVPVP
jgi:quercetin dioxygenase-like cupin family protein